MNLHTLVPIVFSLLLIFGLSVSLYVVFTKKLFLYKDHSMLSALIISPFILSLVLYCLFNFFPHRPGWFYVFFQSFFVIFTIFFVRKYIYQLPDDWHKFFEKARKLSISPTSKILFVLFSFIMLLCTLRIFFWPNNWDDQIYYVEQSYAIGQSRSVKDYFDWGQFDNGVIRYSYNPAIRPGLPLVYSFASLFSNDLGSAIALSRMMTYYFVLVFLGVLILLSKNINKDNKSLFESFLISFLLVFSSYLFVNHSILGFKELPILCVVLLLFDYIAGNQFVSKYLSFIYLGLMTGIISFINLSGSLLSCIIMLLTFFLTKARFSKKVLLFTSSLVVLIFTSGLEFPYFFSWTISGGAKSTNVIEQFKNFVSGISTSATNRYNNQIGEYFSYGINNQIDVITKGKLQGFFQPQFYGLIFWGFLLILIFRYRYLIKNKLLKHLLIFIGLYFLLFIDILGINKQQYAYVTTVSHKYTVFIIPFISLLIASQWEWIKDKLSFFSIKMFAFLNLIAFLFSALFLNKHYYEVFKIVQLIVPIHNSTGYYIEKIALAINVIVITTFICFVFSLVAIIVFSKNANRLWARMNLGSITVILFIFIFPSLFFFETNFGLIDTLKYSTANNEIKLSKIKGWNNLYGMVNFLNRLPTQSKLLLISSPYQLMATHLNIPSRQITFLSNTPTYQLNTVNIYDAIKTYQIDYVLLSPTDILPPNEFLLYATENLFLYDSKFAK